MKIIMLILVGFLIFGCKPTDKKISTASNDPEIINLPGNTQGHKFDIHFTAGKSHNHPTLAIWIEDTTGKFIRTIWVTRAIGSGIFSYGETKDGKWVPGKRRLPAALPVWIHRRAGVESTNADLPSPDNMVPDAISSATPKAGFSLHGLVVAQDVFDVYVEVNQSWDWNQYWTNNKYPEDREYSTSCQPAIVYHARVNSRSADASYIFKPIGHSHHNGSNGSINSDLSTVTTALDIFSDIRMVTK
jgi:hypothetical protein